MPRNSVFRAALARQSSESAMSPAPSEFPTAEVLLRNAGISRPIDLARALKGLGLPPRKAHLVLDELAKRKEVQAELDARGVERDGLEHLLSLGVEAHRIGPFPKVLHR